MEELREDAPGRSHEAGRLELTFALVRSAGALATYCDRAEHSENTDRGVIRAAARELRRVAVETSRAVGYDLQALYAERLAGIEARHPAFGDGMFDGAEGVRKAKSWRQLQNVQYLHDLNYHADVAGLAKWDQVRHYTLHISKLAMLALDASTDSSEQGSWHSFLGHRLPDIVIFGIKLSTVSGEKLSTDTSVDEAA